MFCIPYAFVPAGLNILNGIGRVRVTLSTTGNVSTARIQLIPGFAPGIQPKDSPPLASLLASPVAFQASIPGAVFAVLVDPSIVDHQAAFYTKLRQLRTSYTALPSSWTYPLPSGAQPSDGFGSHRKGPNNVSYPSVGRLHTGVDLVATYGTPVLAAKDGMIISWHHLGATSSSAGADQVLVDHGNGMWTRYLHVALNANKRIYDPVTAGEAFATVGITSGSHLHFEVCQDASITDTVVANNPAYYFGAITYPPAALINPVDLRFGAGATDRLFPAAVVAPPAITNLIITHQKPWLQDVPSTKSAPGITPAGPRYVLAQVVDWKAGYTLPPHGILFESDSNAPVNLVFDRYLPGDATTVAHYLPYLHQTGDKSGLARYSSPQDAQVTAQNKPNWYRYWFAWDPSAYSLTNAGLRSFRITATNNYGITATQQFTFGPQIKGSSIVPGPLGGQQFMFTNVAYLGTNLVANPSLPNFSQPDQYLLQIINTTNGQPLNNITWSPALSSSSHSSVFTVHTNEQVYTFTIPANYSPSGLKLRVSSLLVTNIAHEVAFCACDCPITGYLVPALVDIPAGTFTMGSPTSEAERYSDETQHTVTISHAFKMGKYAVTQAEYQSVMGVNPSYFLGDLACPVEQVSWLDASNYCCRLTACEARAGRLSSGWVYRLPTESEREYACRAGTTTAFHYGSALHGGMANFCSYYEYDAAIGAIYVPSPTTYLGRTTTVGSYQPNAWGLYDMHGNVWEWCRDWYGTYPTGNVTDPQGAASGSDGVIRGGGWSYDGRYCRSAYRYTINPSDGNDGIGFRVVLAPGQP